MKEDDNKINGYALSRQWFDFVHETEEMVRPIHTALYFWIVELNNQMQWKSVFGLPTERAMQSIKVSGYQHYKKALNDLIRWGFITLVSKSHNQHTCNQIKINLLQTLSIKQGIELQTLSIEQGIKQVSDSKTIQTVQTIKQEPGSPAPLKTDFIDSIIKAFTEVFTNYEIVTLGKERNMAGQLLGVWKKHYPALDSDEILKSLCEYFERCHAITDDWYKNNMSLSLMVSKHNEINSLLKAGPKKKGNPFGVGSDQNIKPITESLHNAN